MGAVRSYALALFMHNKHPKPRCEAAYTLVVLYITNTQSQGVKQLRSYISVVIFFRNEQSQGVGNLPTEKALFEGGISEGSL